MSHLDSLVHASFATLVHAVWQVTAIAGLLFVSRLAPQSARARYLGACLALGSIPFVSFATFARVYQSPAALPRVLFSATPNAPLASAAPHGPSAIAMVDGSGWTGIAPIVVTAWACMAIALMVRHVGAHLWLTRRITNIGAPLRGPLADRGQQLARDLRLSTVSFVSLPSVNVPFTVGWWRPVVVVPTSLITAIPAEQLELLLLHELVHIRRADYVVNVLQTVVESLFFFHPAVWWMSRTIQRERELACDEEVLARGHDNVLYARALTDLEGCRAPAAGLSAAGGELATRIRAILGLRVSRRVRLPQVAIALALAMVSVAVACSSMQDASEAPTVAWMPDSVTAHQDLIEDIAAIEGVNADLLALMVLVESGGRPQARSSAGARGLMQLMPTTADTVADEIGMPLVTDDLDDPRINLRLGAHHIASLLQHFEHEPEWRQLELALASYNAGLGAVNAHLTEGAALPDETVRYTRLLLALYRERHAPTSRALDAWRKRVAP